MNQNIHTHIPNNFKAPGNDHLHCNSPFLTFSCRVPSIMECKDEKRLCSKRIFCALDSGTREVVCSPSKRQKSTCYDESSGLREPNDPSLVRSKEMEAFYKLLGNFYLKYFIHLICGTYLIHRRQCRRIQLCNGFFIRPLKIDSSFYLHSLVLFAWISGGGGKRNFCFLPLTHLCCFFALPHCFSQNSGGKTENQF